MDLFDIALAKKLAGGGGGGGSSDFTVATVTLVDPNEVWAELYGAFLDGDIMDCDCYTTDESVQLVLYKGTAVINVQNILNAGATFTVSGNATVVGKGDHIRITGDCTITIS